MTIRKEIIEKCRQKLLQLREETLLQIQETRQYLIAGADHAATSGDEADQSSKILTEAQWLTRSERLRHQLLEIEQALSRIQNGTFGICEETQEPIEEERLLAIPWTRLSIEGAEIRESQRKRLAR